VCGVAVASLTLWNQLLSEADLDALEAKWKQDKDRATTTTKPEAEGESKQIPSPSHLQIFYDEPKDSSAEESQESNDEHRDGADGSNMQEGE
jgi:hypothetical protein